MSKITEINCHGCKKSIFAYEHFANSVILTKSNDEQVYMCAECHLFNCISTHDNHEILLELKEKDNGPRCSGSSELKWYFQKNLEKYRNEQCKILYGRCFGKFLNSNDPCCNMIDVNSSNFCKGCADRGFSASNKVTWPYLKPFCQRECSQEEFHLIPVEDYWNCRGLYGHCIVKGCNGGNHSSGLCGKHYGCCAHEFKDEARDEMEEKLEKKIKTLKDESKDAMKEEMSMKKKQMKKDVKMSVMNSKKR